MVHLTEVAIPPKLRFHLEQRERYERRLDRDFSSEMPDDVGSLMSRTRVGATWTEGRLKARLEYQYAHQLDWTSRRIGSVERSDLSEAFLEYNADGYTASVGRIRPTISSGKLIASPNWGNFTRSFDGVRVVAGPLEAFALRLSVNNVPNHQAHLLGASYQSNLGQTTLIFARDRTSAGRKRLWTLDHVIRRKAGAWTFEAEAAAQVGKVFGKDHAAFAAFVEANRTLDPQTEATLTLHWASGGESEAKSRTFHQLYPAVHWRFGLLGVQGWRNVRHFQLRFDHKFRKGAQGSLFFGGYWLDDPKDAWYGAGSSPNRGRLGVLRDPTGLAGRHMGHELALEFSQPISRTLSLSAGGAIFLPGGGLRRLNGGSASQQRWMYVQLSGQW